MQLDDLTRVFELSEIGFQKYADKGGHKLRGRPQSPEHLAKRIEATKLGMRKKTLACAECGSDFVRTSPAQRYCSGQCWNRVARRKRPKIDRFKISADHYAALLDVQSGKCAICGSEHQSNQRKESLAVDHCHTTGIVRGLLCHRCNTAIGLLKDSTEILNSAINYLNTRQQVYGEEN